MCCADPFLSYLREFGYSVVRLPREDLAPLELLLRSGSDLQQLGRLTSVFAPGRHAPAPRLARDRPAPAFSGRRTGALDTGVGLTLLGSVLSAMAGSSVGIEATYRAARTITFEFRDVTEDSVAIIDLDRYLTDARIRQPSSHIARLLETGDLFVTTAVVRSRRLVVDARDEHGVSIGVTLPVVQPLAGGRLEVGQSDDGSSALVYAGSTPLAFGFRALRLFYDEGQYQAFSPLPPGQAALTREDGGREWLDGEGRLVGLTHAPGAPR